MKIKSLHVYPLKSGRAIDLKRAEVTAWGLADDRRFMIADPSGKFITQRELPALAKITAILANGTLGFSTADRDVSLSATFDPARRMQVNIWRSDVSASLAADAVNASLSEWLDQPVILVHADDVTRRQCNHEWSDEDVYTGFADGYPVLITTTGSLDALNEATRKAGEQMFGMDRFRPNIVIDDERPFADDFWESIDIAGIRFDLVKPCTRCIITTQDQITGERGGADPMPALRRLRMSTDRRVPGVLFGWNAIARSTGKVALGDAVTITARRPEGWPIRQD